MSSNSAPAQRPVGASPAQRAPLANAAKGSAPADKVVLSVVSHSRRRRHDTFLGSAARIGLQLLCRCQRAQWPGCDWISGSHHRTAELRQGCVQRNVFRPWPTTRAVLRVTGTKGSRWFGKRRCSFGHAIRQGHVRILNIQSQETDVAAWCPNLG